MSSSVKTYKFNTHADIANLSYATILLIPPGDVNYSIETQTGGVTLNDDKLKALKSLLKYKKSLDEKDAELNLEGFRFLTKTQSLFNPIAPVEGNSVINVLVDKNLTYIAGNSIIVTNLDTPLQTKFEATVVSYNHSTGMLSFNNIINLKGVWATNTPAVINLDGIDGQRGATGLKGDQGVTGPQGIQGVTGPQGIQGPTGLKGDQGVTGPQGIQGPTGLKGDQGVTGPQGIQGPTGAKGDQGQAIVGPTGAKGDQGQAIVGPTGAKGDQGPTGAKGDQGQAIVGPTGAKGDQGQAIVGPTGAKGDQGPTGPVGQNGTNGVDGATGPAGQNGVDGATGPTGPAGPSGGPTGPAGPVGPTGITSLLQTSDTTGMYQVWVDANGVLRWYTPGVTGTIVMHV